MKSSATLKIKRHIKLVIFDMDGTLYNFVGGKTFSTSLLHKKVLSNARFYVAHELDMSRQAARETVDDILRSDSEGLSIGLEKKFGMDRQKYFDTVWNIPAKKYIRFDKKTRDVIREISKSYKIVLLSDAPRVWIESVLHEMKIAEFFGKNISSGEGANRKHLGTAFAPIIKKYRVKSGNCVVVGDQEHTDIVPAQVHKLLTVKIAPNGTHSAADVVISSIVKFPEALVVLERLTIGS